MQKDEAITPTLIRRETSDSDSGESLQLAACVAGDFFNKSQTQPKKGCGISGGAG